MKLRADSVSKLLLAVRDLILLCTPLQVQLISEPASRKGAATVDLLDKLALFGRSVFGQLTLVTSESLTIRTNFDFGRPLLLGILHFHRNLGNGFCGVGVILAPSFCSFIVTEDSMSEVTEGNQDNSYVVQGSPEQTILNQVVDAKARKLVNRLCVRIKSFEVFCAIPNDVDGFFVVYFVKNTVAAEDNEVVLFLNPEGLDLRCGNQHHWITSEL